MANNKQGSKGIKCKIYKSFNRKREKQRNTEKIQIVMHIYENILNLKNKG